MAGKRGGTDGSEPPVRTPSAGAHELLVSRSPIGMIRETEDGRVLEANEAAARLVGVDDPAELVGRTVGTLFEEPERVARNRHQVVRHGEHGPRDLPLRTVGGTTLWVRDHSVLVTFPDGHREILRTLVDIDRRRERERGLTRLAYHDPLTGLANRRLLEIRAEQALALAGRRGHRAGLIFFDLVDFKGVNDRFGHAAGDDLLTAVARRLEESLRAADTAARTGGDEFVVLLSEVDHPSHGPAAAARLRENASRPILLEGERVNPQARAGVALYPEDGRDLDTLMYWADHALIRAKRTGESVVSATEVRARPEAGPGAVTPSAH